MGKTLIIGEAGSNWHVGDHYTSWLIQGKKLIKIAKDAGCDAVKFQSWRKGIMYADAPENVALNVEVDQYSLPEGLIKDLYEECQKIGIEFMCSVFSEADVDLVDPYVNRHKIASSEIGHELLFRRVATAGKPIIFSTGGARDEDVRRSLEWCGGLDVTIMHCNFSYPTSIEHVQLSRINELYLAVEAYSKDANVQFGFSDHTMSTVVPALAVTNGATVVEKHFTTDRRLFGPDHHYALEPYGLAEMVRNIREAEKVDEVEPRNDKLIRFAHRSVQAIEDIKKGDTLYVGKNIATMRPGNAFRGENAHELTKMNYLRALRDIPKGQGVLWDYLSEDEAI